MTVIYRISEWSCVALGLLVVLLATLGATGQPMWADGGTALCLGSQCNSFCIYVKELDDCFKDPKKLNICNASNPCSACTCQIVAPQKCDCQGP